MKAFIATPSPFPSLPQLYIQDTHGPIATGAQAEQGFRKKLSLPLVSLRNLESLRNSPFPWSCMSKHGAQAGLASDGPNPTEATHYSIRYKYFY